MDKLAVELTAMGHPISADTVRTELTNLGFSRQANRKADEGSKHPHRNAQFEHINANVLAAQAAGQPVISVDTTTKAGLKVESALDTRTYEKGIKVSNAEMKTLDIEGDEFHPEWNYTIRPGHPKNS